MPDSTTEALRRHVPDGVVGPAEDGWDDARAAWNLALDQHPEAVVRVGSVEDVVGAVRAAGELGLRVATQATGHGASARGSLEGAILLRTEGLRGVTVDASARRAHVRAGTPWADVAARADPHGLAALAGTAGDVSVAGYTLGGGIGWLARRHGLACNSVRSAEVVTADGRVLRADPEREADLFWALRGGGGSFGVVTALEFELFPAPDVCGGGLFWPLERAAEVLATWRGWAPGLPDHIVTFARLMRFPPLEEVPEPLRGNAFVVVEAGVLGTEAETASLLAPLRALGPGMDTVATMPPSGLATVNMDPPMPVPYSGDGGLLSDLPDGAQEALLESDGPGRESPLLSIELRSLGGALATPPPGCGALATLEAPWCWFAVGFAPVPPAVPAIEAHIDRLRAALEPWDFGGSYMNFAERPGQDDLFFPPETARRLREVRSRYDPDGRFLANHPIAAEPRAA